MCTYILENKEWVFSGIGITLFTVIIPQIVKFVKHLIIKHRLKHTPSRQFDYPFQDDEYWPFEFAISEPSKKFLLNCSIKTHNLLLKRIKNEIKPYDRLIWLDIDRFTQVNKLFGKDCGDIIIYTILMIINSVVMASQIDTKVFHAEKRDEFYLVGPRHKMNDYFIRILISAIQRHDWSSIAPGIFITCSAGVASYRISSTDTLKRARVSLNLMKAKGGNGIGPEIHTLHPYELVSLVPS